MKKVLFLFGFLSVASVMNLFMLTENAASNLTKENEYLLDNENISFELADAWKENYDTDYDLSLTKLQSTLDISIYKTDEIDMTAKELLSSKIKEELSEMDSRVLVKKYNVNTTRNRTIYSSMYSATKDNIQSEYFFSVVEFDNSGTYLFVVYESKGSYMKYTVDDIQRLLLKIEWNGEKAELI